eukprot:SAG22_NODE_6830_length_806_cov_1.258840_2_plen_86_part_01
MAVFVILSCALAQWVRFAAASRVAAARLRVGGRRQRWRRLAEAVGAWRLQAAQARRDGLAITRISARRRRRVVGLALRQWRTAVAA